MDINRVAALVQLTRLTSLSFKSSLTGGAAEVILQMPTLRKLAARQLIVLSVGGKGDTDNASQQPPREQQTLTQVCLVLCDHPAQLLLLPQSVTELTVQNLSWTLPDDVEERQLAARKRRDTVKEYLHLVRHTSLLLHRLWSTSFKQVMTVRCPPNMFGEFVTALGLGEHAKLLKV